MLVLFYEENYALLPFAPFAQPVAAVDRSSPGELKTKKYDNRPWIFGAKLILVLSIRFFDFDPFVRLLLIALSAEVKSSKQ
jgi:hypothetical protein